MVTLPLCPAACGSGSDTALWEEAQAGQQSSLHHMVHSIGWVSLVPSWSPLTYTEFLLSHTVGSLPHITL